MIYCYLAAPWAEKEYAKTVRDKCVEAGINITSRWLDFPTGGDMHDVETLKTESVHDFEDVAAADMLLLLNMQKRGEETSGKAVETGMAIAWEMPVYMVGKPSNVFHYHPRVKQFDTVDEAIKGILDAS